MLPSCIVSAGCLASIVISVWIGSYYLPHRSKSSRSPAVKELARTHWHRMGHQNPALPLPNPRRDLHGDNTTPNISPLDFRLTGHYDHLRRRLIDWPIYPPRGLLPPGSSQIQRITTHVLVEDWRKSILGLISLSERNLKSAEERFAFRDELTAVQVARTAVENMARALIHCCGGKPDTDPGQEEVLRMHSHRFKEETRTTFENALDKIAYLMSNLKAKQTLQTASEITFAFKGLILDVFREEMRAFIGA